MKPARLIPCDVMLDSSALRSVVTPWRLQVTPSNQRSPTMRFDGSTKDYSAISSPCVHLTMPTVGLIRSTETQPSTWTLMHMGPVPDGQGGLPTKSNGRKQGGHRAAYHRGNWRPSTGEPRYRCWTCSRSSHIPVGNVAWRRVPTYASKNRTKPHAHVPGQWVPTHASKHHVKPQAARSRPKTVSSPHSQ